MRVDADGTSSMADDLARGRLTEIDELQGEVVRMARRLGMEAPACERITDLVHDAERAGGGLVSVIVADMSEAVAGLRQRGLTVDADEGTVVAQVATLLDPDGNQVTLVEAR